MGVRKCVEGWKRKVRRNVGRCGGRCEEVWGCKEVWESACGEGGRRVWKNASGCGGGGGRGVREGVGECVGKYVGV